MNINPFQSLARTALLQDINYTKFDRTKDITEGDYKLTLDYGPYKNRKKTVLEYQNSVTQTRYYSGDYEKTINTVSGVTTTQEVHYISCGNGVTVAYVIEGTTSAYHYLHTDYLGSILAVSDASGNLEYEQNFDAWGRDRNPVDWSYTASTSPRPSWLYRGFTGHEHLREFTLINMNARMYDTETGRMLAVDNYVLDAHNSQDYNRYSYARNNRLKYSDPSGESIVPVIMALAGAYLGGASANGTLNPTKWDYNSSQTYWGTGIGAITGGLGGYAFMSGQSTSFVGGFGEGAASGFSSGFITGYTAGGGSPKERLISGLRYGLTSAALQGTVNGIVGARHAKNLGLSGWDGSMVEIEYAANQEKILPSIGQGPSSLDCVRCNLASIDQSYGGNLSVEDIRSIKGLTGYGDLFPDKAVDDYSLYLYQNQGIFQSSKNVLIPERTMDNIINHMNSNGRVVISYTNAGAGHQVTAKSVYRSVRHFPNGRVKYGSYKVGLMNPAASTGSTYGRSIGQQGLYDANTVIFIYR